MKYLITVMVIMLSFSISGCGGCDDENPSLVLVNNGTDVADIQIKTSGGNTVNINNIPVGSQSEKKTFDSGDIEFTITIQGLNEPIVYNLKISTCKDYIVKIKADNTVSGSGIDRD